MYYPYLRARQFELIALRELAQENVLQGFVQPIIVPVKKSMSNLNIAFKIFKEKECPVYMILNPSVGELKSNHDALLEYYNSIDKAFVFPAFIYQNNAGFIQTCITKYHLDDCLIICKNDISSEDTPFRDLLALNNITSICMEDPGHNRSLDRLIRSFEKKYIRLDDLFEKQLRNSAYLDIEKHRFSEEHIYYKDENFNGFSDFTVLPSEYSDGGSTPRAVVIHLTYLNRQSQVWIRHFTSTTNDSISNVQGKFAQAVEKAVTYCRENQFTNSAIKELEKYYDEQHYPGLGIVKKISIKNHLIIVAKYLSK